MDFHVPGSSVQRIADHVMVFMIVGICKKWKQPVAYFFSQNGMKKEEIAKNIKDIITELNSIGLVVDIVCPARDWEILNCIKLTQHYKMH
jgi:hypothetical protein